MPSIGASIATRGLHVGADVAGVDRDVVGLGGRQARARSAPSISRPQTFSNGTRPTMLLDVDAAVAQRRAFLVGLGDLGLERDDALEARGGPRSCWLMRLLRRRGSVPHRFCLPVAAAHAAGPGGRARVARGWIEDATDPYADLRREYADGGLDEADLAADPFAMFRRWYDDAVAAGLYEPNAMVVATVVGRRPARPRGWCCSRASPSDGLRVLHQHRLPQGRRAGRPTRAARCSSRGTRWSGRSGSTGTATRAAAGGRRRLLRHAAARVAARRLGLATSRARSPRRAELERGLRRPRTRRTPTRCRAARRVGRLPGRARGRGVLAGPAGPDARPARLPAVRDARLDHPPPRPLSLGSPTGLPRRGPLRWGDATYRAGPDRPRGDRLRGRLHGVRRVRRARRRQAASSGSAARAGAEAARAVDTSHPDHVVGNGTPSSCTSRKVVAAVAKGGVITFRLRPRPGRDQDARHREGGQHAAAPAS